MAKYTFYSLVLQNAFAKTLQECRLMYTSEPGTKDGMPVRHYYAASGLLYQQNFRATFNAFVLLETEQEIEYAEEGATDVIRHTGNKFVFETDNQAVTFQQAMRRQGISWSSTIEERHGDTPLMIFLCDPRYDQVCTQIQDAIYEGRTGEK